jgi:hypothetical protein
MFVSGWLRGDRIELRRHALTAASGQRFRRGLVNGGFRLRIEQHERCGWRYDGCFVAMADVIGAVWMMPAFRTWIDVTAAAGYERNVSDGVDSAAR